MKQLGSRTASRLPGDLQRGISNDHVATQQPPAGEHENISPAARLHIVERLEDYQANRVRPDASA